MSSLRNKEELSGCIPSLVNKLCNHYAKNNTELSTRLFKLCINFLTSPSLNSSKEIDDQKISYELRRYFQETVSSEDVSKFDVLFTKIQASTVLKHKPNLYSFLLMMASGKETLEPSKWSIPSDIHMASSTNSTKYSSKSHMTFLPIDDPKVSVKRLYQGNLSRNFSNASSKTATMTSNTVSLSNSDQDIFNKDHLSSCSSRSTINHSVTEAQLIQEVIYSLQGIEGKIIRREPGGLGFTIDPKTGKHISPIQRGLITRLTSVGYLHNLLNQHCNEADKQIGLIGQSLISFLRNELTNYYQLIAFLQAQAKIQSCSENSELSLRRMVVWVAEPQMHLQWLCYIAEQCVDKKGGALISAIHGFLQHGATTVQKISEKVLLAVCRPLYLMLSKWLLHGELSDPCGEFFIEVRSINDVERLWHDKYYVRKSMIPSFITLDQANKILATGKSINFLRQICKDVDELPGRDALQKLFANSLEALFNPEQSIELHSALETVFRDTSLRVLHLLRNKYNLIEHMQAMRRYLLLGQGDFIRHLLELLAPELSKPAHNIYGHTLTAILESAIRVTSAQYESEDTLSRLTIGLMETSKEDVGWDVFSLVYLADGPVGTIFQPTSSTYKSLFGGLWRAKRMEFVLSNMRKQQISSNKLFKCIPELRKVTHQLHILTNEMIHFLHQTQYYFIFEVLECSWAEMLKQVNQAVCLDDVIIAHNTFLNSVQCGVLLDQGSADLRVHLATIFNLILNLESLQETLYITAAKEKQGRDAYEELTNCKTGFGVTKETERENRERLGKFKESLKTLHSQVFSIATQFRSSIIRYVSLLASSPDMNLQVLSTRLNFNDFYKIM